MNSRFVTFKYYSLTKNVNIHDVVHSLECPLSTVKKQNKDPMKSFSNLEIVV